MSTAGDAFRAGDIAAAVAAATAAVKAAPTEAGPRWLLAEMLLFAGDIERADRVLEAAALREPSPPVLEFRRLIRAELARRQFFADGRVPRFQGGEPTPALQKILHACVLLRAGEMAAAADEAAAAEAMRPRVPGWRGAAEFDDLRDGDDLLAPLIEVHTTAGNYIWVPTDRLAALTPERPQRPRDLFWTRAAISMADGTDGVVYLPMLYPWGGPDCQPALRLGRATEWLEEAAGAGLVRGLGGRAFLLGEEMLSPAELGAVEFGMR